MSGDAERNYSSRRALEDLGRTLHVDCTPARDEHNALTGLYLRRCLFIAALQPALR